jgi:hypothetical protein
MGDDISRRRRRDFEETKWLVACIHVCVIARLLEVNFGAFARRQICTVDSYSLHGKRSRAQVVAHSTLGWLMYGLPDCNN